MMKKLTQKFFANSRGSTAVEYGLIAGLVGLALTAALANLGEGIKKPIECTTKVVEGTATSCK